MNLIDTKGIDESIAKLNELKGLACDTAKLLGECRYLTTKDVAKQMGVSEAAAREYMSRADFPLLRVGKSFKVSSWAFLLYNMQARK